MQTIINNAIEHINQGTIWALENGEPDKMKVYKALVKERRVLKKIKNTYNVNPAVALYGRSQCGKSHLSSSLLSADGTPMKVVDRVNGKQYEFLTQLNPPGNGEATGLITRFTTKKQDGITAEYPVHVRLMSVKDIVLMLCDGYYRDYEKRKSFNEDEVANLLTNLKENKKTHRQHYLSEDDLGEIEEYFGNFFSGKYQSLLSVDYFGELSLIIEYLDENDVVRSMNMLWNEDENLSGIFRQFFAACKMVDFAHDAYISFEELVNNPKEFYSLLDVRWLNLKKEETCAMSKVCCLTPQGGQNVVAISKAYLAAICAEVVLEVVPPKEGDTGEKVGYIRSILEHVDILDFPGARARGGVFEIKGNEGELLRRGKVAYSFNKYSSERNINALMFCWHPDIFDAKPMQDVLHRWITVSIGRDEKERSNYLKGMKVPPLFFVGTMFNLHLQSKTNDRKDNPEALDDRWKKWFGDQLSKDIIGIPSNPSEVSQAEGIRYHDWFESWTLEQPNFDNIYLLRDFRYSQSIFDGWTEQGGCETGRRPNYELYEDFYRKLRDSFLNASFVQKHFKDAAIRWDEASEPNCDGSLTIARNLASIVESIANIATTKNKNDVMEAVENVVEELNKHYYSTSSEEAMRQACDAAAGLQAAFDNNCGNPEYFGQYYGLLMKEFAIAEDDVKKVFDEVVGTTHPESNMGRYLYIYMKAPNIDPSNSYKVNLEILSNAYGFSNIEKCEQYFKNDLGVDLEDLFRNNSFGLQSLSQIMVSHLKSYYFDTHLKINHKDALRTLLPGKTYDDVVGMLLALFEKFDIDKKIEAAIHHYVDAFGVQVEEITGMVSDMCSEMINKFVLSVGYDYYKDQEGVVDTLKQANEQHNIQLSFKFVEQKRQPMSDEHVAKALDKMCELTDERIMYLRKTSPEEAENELAEAYPFYGKGCRWRDLMKMGFVLTKDIPTYDIKANAKLGEIIEKCKQNIELCQHQ